MHSLIETAKRVVNSNDTLPFSVYSSVKEQRMLNVPIIKPLLIFVLSGVKNLGQNDEKQCPSGSFVFLSNTPNVAMRNIPNDEEYFALLVEFEYSDFDCLQRQPVDKNTFIYGDIEPVLELTLQQFVEWCAKAPADVWHMRRQELLKVLYSLGHNQVASIMEPPTLSHKVHQMIINQLDTDIGAAEISSNLAMSESTLRRKLSAEGTHLQSLKDRAKLGHGLHLIQSTYDSISLIAERCGYVSQSRFTDKFKQLFGVTPSALRKTRMSDMGE